MFIYLFYYIFFINYSIISNNPLNSLQELDIEISDDYAFNIFRSIVIYLIGRDDSFIDNLNLSDQCHQHLKNSLFQFDMSLSVSSYTYYKKIFLHSSRNKNDLSSYSDCINNPIDNYIGNNPVTNFTFLTVLIDDNKSLYDLLTSNKGVSSFLIGICFIDNCTINDYQKIIKKSMIYLNLTKEENELNETNDASEVGLGIKIYKMNDNKKSEGFIKFLEWLPFIIMFIHFFFVLFNSIPVYFYKIIIFVFCCKDTNNTLLSSRPSKLKNNLINKKSKIKKAPQKELKERKERNTSSLSYISTEDNIIKSLELLYNINNNFASLIELKKQNEITNDGGLSFINGIKGISMIFYLFGSVYSVLYSSVITEQSSEVFYSQLTDLFFSIFYIGIKYAPKLLLCTSGFSLFFKFLCFLDGKKDVEKGLYRQKNDNSINVKEIQDFKNNTSSLLSSNSSFHKFNNKEKSNIDNNLISYKLILNFVALQLHKYIIYILFICFVLYSLDWIVSTFGASGPVWEFFYNSLISSAQNLKYLIPLIIGYKSYLFPGLTPEKENILHYFYLVFQEIIYFLISITIIFIGYKNNLRIDIFFKIVFFILIIFRIAYYFLYVGLDDKDYFGYNKYGQFYNSMIYDYSFYIIGIHYGMINYVIQKAYSVKDCNKQNKRFLISSLNVLGPFKKKNKRVLRIISIICSVLIIINIFIQQIIIYIIRFIKSNELKKNMELYKKDFFSQVIMLFDSDIFIISLNSLALSMYIKGDNLINDILCHSLWSIFNRFYFSYILLINPIILYLLYNIESTIAFNIWNCIFYSFICGIFVYFLTMIIYVTFELPLKKLLRFWFKMSESGAYKGRLSNIEVTYSYCKNNNFLDSVTPSITDYNEEDEEEDEY